MSILKLVALLSIPVLTVPALAQRECGTPSPSRLIQISEQMMRNPQQQDPTMIKIFVHVCANDNGTLRAAEDTSIIRQLNNMQEFYAPHNLCFSLLGIRQINSTDLNNHNKETEEADLFDWLIADVINIFIHDDLFDNSGPLNGTAYDIPNTYLSVIGSIIQSADNRSTTAHEMGHCLGLYHTFETANGQENVERVGTCANCNNAGDLLCDTQADPHSDTYDTDNVIDVNCNYLGTVTDNCGDEYNMDPHNIMTYGRRACRDVLTSSQGSRMHAFLALNDELEDCVANGSISFDPDANTTISGGWALYTARNPFTVQGNDFTINGTAHGHFVAPYVKVLRTVHFEPGQGGVIEIKPNILCE